MLRVSDIMSADVFTLADDITLDRASWQLNAEMVSGAPVRNAAGEIVGFISKTDIVDHEKQQGTLAMTKVSEAMSRKVWCVDVSETARTAVEMMADKNIHHLVVVDAQGVPKGIVTPLDVVKALAAGKSF